MIFKSPIIRITLSLILLTISLLLISEMLGMVPNQSRVELNARKAIAETLAIQVSYSAMEEQQEILTGILATLISRNENILSIGLRSKIKGLLASAGDHANYWHIPDDNKSTAEHVQVPIHNRNGRWGQLEISFKPINNSIGDLFSRGSFFTMVLFLSIGGFISYWLFLKRALHELDPSSAVPERVRAAFDTLAEGLVVIDKSERIIMANSTFQQKLGKSENELLGKSLSTLSWQRNDREQSGSNPVLPWRQMLETNTLPSTQHLLINNPQHETVTFAVNVSPIKAANQTIRGAIVTFDDETQIVRKNTELENALKRLHKSQQEINQQNRELTVLATRDPLTQSLNRRSLFDALNTLLDEAKETGNIISCIMVDIDHFKSINDRFGHATGDKVIKLLASILQDAVRTGDLVGRYGGEEFVVILPNITEEAAAKIADRIRINVYEGKSNKFTTGLTVSASFGVSSTENGEWLSDKLVDQADQALYVAKESGRNRVIRYSNKDNIYDSSSVEDNEHSKDQNSNLSKDQVNTDQIPHISELYERIQELETQLQQANERNTVEPQEFACTSNQVVIIDRIQQAIRNAQRNSTSVAILTINISTLQAILNSMGSGTVEKLRQLIIKSLFHNLRTTDSLAQISDNQFSLTNYSKDEFIIIITGIPESEITTWIIKRILKCLKNPFDVEGNEIILRSYIGASVYPNDSDDSEALLAFSNLALQEAIKDTTGDDFSYYNENINKRAKSQLYMENQLYHAISRDQLFINYQPIVSLQTGRVDKIEALLRWQHPEMGLVSPIEFIAIAEHSGMIKDISKWVITKTCRQLKLWHQSGYTHLKMAINISAVELLQGGYAKNIIELVKHEGISPEYISIEITETAIIDRIELLQDFTTQLHLAGFHISLDDFGTGYSSLTYLRQLSINWVKIDRSFVSNIPESTNDIAIINAIISLAHNLNMQVIAEGVETEEQLKILYSLGCDYVQGYLISHPVLPEEAFKFFSSPYIRNINKLLKFKQNENKYGDDKAVITGVLNQPPKNQISKLN